MTNANYDVTKCLNIKMKRQMKKYLIFFFIVFLFTKVNAQNEITGIVTNQNNEPLIGANVFLIQQNKGTITDPQGQFVITDLPNGKIIIQVSYIGYQNYIETINMNNIPVDLKISMKHAPIAAQEVIISGTFNNSQHENAVKIDVLKLSNISNINTPNFMEVITRVPGVDMITKGNGVSKPVIRGLSMNNILVLNNGVRIENYQYSENHPLGIDENSIEKIEIIKGASSLLYGSDAIGGVLNFIKEKPAPVGKIIGDYSLKLYSNSLGINSGLGIKGSTKNIYAGFRFGMKSHSDYLIPNNDFVNNSRFNEKSIHANFGLTKNFGTMKLFYDYFKQDLGMTVPATISIVNERDRKNNIWYQDLTHQVIASQNKFFLGSSTLEFNASFQNAYRKLNTTLDAPTVEMNLNTVSYETKLFFPSNNKNKYVIGVQGYYQKNNNKNNRISQFLPDADINSNSIFGLFQHRFFKTFKLQTGIRLDNYIIKTKPLGEEGGTNYHKPVENDYFRLNSSLGFTYHKNKTNLRFNLAKAFRSPNIAELTSNGIHGNRFEKGNADLIPQDAYETDISLHYHANNITFDLAGFYNYIYNYIFVAPTNDTTASGLTIYKFSQTNAQLFGFEAGVHFHPKQFDCLHLEVTYSATKGIDNNNNYLPFIPANKIRSELRFEKETVLFLTKPYFKINLISAFAQNNPALNESKTDAYNIFNISVGSNMKIFNQLITTSISVSNIFNKEYFDHLSTLKGLNFYNQGRSINLAIKIPFVIK